MVPWWLIFAPFLSNISTIFKCPIWYRFHKITENCQFSQGIMTFVTFLSGRSKCSKSIFVYIIYFSTIFNQYINNTFVTLIIINENLKNELNFSITWKDSNLIILRHLTIKRSFLKACPSIILLDIDVRTIFYQKFHDSIMT